MNKNEERKRLEDVQKQNIPWKKWGHLALAFTGKPFRPVNTEYFTPSQLEQARAWVA